MRLIRSRAADGVALTLLLLCGAAALPAQRPGFERASVRVEPDRSAYVAGETVRLLAELVFDEGWHANANPASFDFLIPTSIEATLPAGWPAGEATYPPGQLRSFAFADEPILVYEGTAYLILRTAVPVGTDDGELPIPVVVTYQACDHQRCLPPIRSAHEVRLTVGTGGTLTELGRQQAATAGVMAAGDGSSGPGAAGPGLAWILLLGLAGGLILNAMPCVLPVLSLKLLGLVEGAGRTRREVAAGAWMTALGILTSFWGLAAAAIGARLAGGAVGWGVQFQDPRFVTVLAVIVAFFCLNLWGLFEFGLPRWLSRVNPGNGGSLAGHFGTGLFTTLMATPCSAPFLGTAVAFALTQPAGTVVAVATAIGLGMALPYLLLAWTPGLVRWLPRPGAWMDTLKVVMGFLLAATVVWLLFVLSGLVSSATVAYLQVGLLALALALWLRSRARGSGARRLATVAALAAVCATLAVSARAPRAAGTEAWQSNRLISWQEFERDEAERLAASGRLVFVDVTADWCVTCKFNERYVLETDDVAAAFARHDVVAMKADWTSHSPDIARFLADHGRYGIPFYLLYRPERPPHVFGELITRQGVIDVIGESATSSASTG